MKRNRFVQGVAAILIGLIVAAVILIVRETFFRPKTVTAYFTTATAIYPGDEVRIAGIKAGSVASIQPDGTQTKWTTPC